MKQSEAVIIGGGHNGLVCACYLAAAGIRTTILERRSIVGGAAVTEEFHPGFRNSVASYTVSLLNPGISADLHLKAHGLSILERPFSNFLPLPDGNYLRTGATFEETRDQFARFSAHDAAQLSGYYAMLEKAVLFLRPLALETPPGTGGSVLDMWRAVKGWNRIRKLAPADLSDLYALFTRSAGEILDGWFASDPIKALFGFDAIVGNFASPYTPGSAYVLLHHVSGEVNGKTGQWGHAVGGMGAITQALAAAARQAGVSIRLEAPVARVIVENGRAAGVLLETGEQIRAACVIANVNPSLLYLKLVDRSALPGDFYRRISMYKNGSGTFRMNVALSELPSFACAPEGGSRDYLQSGIIIAPSLAYMEQAYLDARAGGWAQQPVIEMLVPSTMDNTLAPQGAHVASLFCQHFNPQLADGLSWDTIKEQVADHIIDTVDLYAPNFKRSIVGRMTLSPLDLEKLFGMTGGDIFHGRMSLDQLYSARPLLGYADYRGPIPGLYMCGSGTHPGGGVTGIPGHNAAREIIRDHRSGRLFKKNRVPDHE
jgi:phytoene dehydrogenase-like protein